MYVENQVKIGEKLAENEPGGVTLVTRRRHLGILTSELTLRPFSGVLRHDNPSKCRI